MMGRDQEANTLSGEDMKKLPTRRTYNIKREARTKLITEKDLIDSQSGWVLPRRKTVTVLSGVSKHLETNVGSAFPVQGSFSGRSGSSMTLEQQSVSIGQKRLSSSGFHLLETRRSFGEIYSRRTGQAEPASGIETGISSLEKKKSGQISSSLCQIPTRRTARPTSRADKSITGKPSLSLEQKKTADIFLCQIPTRRTARPTSRADKLITGKTSLSLEAKNTGRILVKQTPASGIETRLTSQQPLGSSSLDERKSGQITSNLCQIPTRRTGKSASRADKSITGKPGLSLETKNTGQIPVKDRPTSGIERRLTGQQSLGSSYLVKRKSDQTSFGLCQIPTKRTARPSSRTDNSITGKPSLSLEQKETADILLCQIPARRTARPTSRADKSITGKPSLSLEQKKTADVVLCQIPTRRTARPTSRADKLITGKPSLSLEPKNTGQIPVNQTRVSGIERRITHQQPSGSSSIDEMKSGQITSNLCQIPTRRTAKPTSYTEKSITGKPSLSIEPKNIGQIPIKQTPTSVLLMPEDHVRSPVHQYPVLRCTSSYKCISARPSSDASFPISSMEEKVDTNTNSGVKTSTSENNETHNKNLKRAIEDIDREYIGPPTKSSRLDQSKCVGTRYYAII